MTERKRRRIFIFLTLIFIIVGTAAISYAKGWRFDYATKTFQKVGGIYIKTKPSDAQVILNGKVVDKKPGFLQTGVLIDNLLPRRYELTVVSPDYKPWKRNVTVAPSLVKEFKHVTLVPAIPEIAASGPIKDFWIINQKTLLQKKDGRLWWQDQQISGGKTAGFTSDARKLLAREEKTNVYYLVDLENNSSINLNAVIAQADKRILSKHFEILTNTEDNSKLIILTNNSIHLLDTQKKNISILFNADSKKGEIISKVQSSPSLIIWSSFFNNEGYSKINVYEKVSGSTTTADHIISNKTSKISWISGSKFAVLQEGGGLYIFDAIQKNASKIASDVIDFEVSWDSNLIAALENSAIEVLSTRENKAYYRRLSPETPALIKKIEWHKDNRHLFLHYPGKFLLLDLDDENAENVTLIDTGEKGGYDEKSNKFYLLKNENGGKLLSFLFPE